MLSVWIPWLLLLLSIGFAARKGGEPEQVVAAIIVSMVLLDIANHHIFGDPTWFEVNPGHFVIDLWAFLSLTWVAVWANRGWPLLISATQLIVVNAHFGKLLEIDEARLSYWLMTHLPNLAQLIVLMAGTAAHVMRQRRLGTYPAWRRV